MLMMIYTGLFRAWAQGMLCIEDGGSIFSLGKTDLKTLFDKGEKGF